MHDPSATSCAEEEQIKFILILGAANPDVVVKAPNALWPAHSFLSGARQQIPIPPFSSSGVPGCPYV